MLASADKRSQLLSSCVLNFNFYVVAASAVAAVVAVADAIVADAVVADAVAAIAAVAAAAAVAASAAVAAAAATVVVTVCAHVGALGGQKRASNPLELELQAVASCLT